MKLVNDELVLEMASYILEQQCTIRETAQQFGLSKSTVHVRFRKHLPELNADLSQEVSFLLKKNLEEAPARGGIATKKKFAK